MKQTLIVGYIPGYGHVWLGEKQRILEHGSHVAWSASSGYLRTPKEYAEYWSSNFRGGQFIRLNLSLRKGGKP